MTDFEFENRADAPKIIYALADRRKFWQDEPPASGLHTGHWGKYHHDDTVTQLQAKLDKVEEARQDAALSNAELRGELSALKDRLAHAEEAI
jgi:hypothetical protein